MPSRNSNCHNFSHGRPIKEHNISRHQKFKNGSSREIQMVITFYTDVRFDRITYNDARNLTTEPFEKFKWHNFSLECTILGHNISRCWQLNNGCSREIPMVITFHMDVRLRSIIYRDTRHLTTEALEKFKWS